MGWGDGAGATSLRQILGTSLGLSQPLVLRQKRVLTDVLSEPSDLVPVRLEIGVTASLEHLLRGRSGHSRQRYATRNDTFPLILDSSEQQIAKSTLQHCRGSRLVGHDRHGI